MNPFSCGFRGYDSLEFAAWKDLPMFSFAQKSSGGTADASESSPMAAAPSSGATSQSQLDLASLLPVGWETSGTAMKMTGTLLSNPYFSAGAGLWVLTMGGMVGRQASLVLSTFLRRKFVVSMEMTNQDPSFTCMMRWMASHPRFKVQQMSVMTRSRGVQISSTDQRLSHCIFGPCPNVRHFFFYEGRPITLTRRRRDNVGGGYEAEVFETLEFTTIGTSSAFFQDIMKEAEVFSQMEDSNHTVIYTNGGSNWIRQPQPRSRRPIQSVVLPGDIGDTILADVKKFLGSNDYYRSLGVPYRRGYLLHGPPGCGKTSYVMALAGELRLSISLLSLSNRGLNDEALMSLLNSAQMDSIVLLEDIDRAFSNDSNVTMSGLLNALDGVGAQEGRLVFMTTNHVEVLDPALIRPGRADVKLEIGLLDRHQAEQMFRKFFPAAPCALVEAFSRQIPPQTLSVAQVQAHLFFHRESPEAAVKTIDSFIQSSIEFDKAMEAKRRKTKQMSDLPRAPLLKL